MSTHEVTNQVPALCGYNVDSIDPSLREGIDRWGPAQDHAELETLGGAHGHTFGTLTSDLVNVSAGPVIERSFPA